MSKSMFMVQLIGQPFVDYDQGIRLSLAKIVE
jgi:hypothetical protein